MVLKFYFLKYRSVKVLVGLLQRTCAAGTKFLGYEILFMCNLETEVYISILMSTT